MCGDRCVGKNEWRFSPEVIKGPASKSPRAGTVATVGLRRSHSFPGSQTDPGGRAAGAGPPPSLRDGRGSLTSVASSRARTSRIRKGSKPRPTVQKNRAPAAGRHTGSLGPAAMAARGHVVSGARARRMSAPSEAACGSGPAPWSQRLAGRECSGGSGRLGWPLGVSSVRHLEWFRITGGRDIIDLLIYLPYFSDWGNGCLQKPRDSESVAQLSWGRNLDFLIPNIMNLLHFCQLPLLSFMPPHCYPHRTSPALSSPSIGPKLGVPRTKSRNSHSPTKVSIFSNKMPWCSWNRLQFLHYLG